MRDAVEALATAQKAVAEERRFQDNKWGSVDENPHTIGEWIIIMESELAEAKTALIKGGTGRNSVLHEIVQTVAVGMACLEQHGIKEIKKRSV
jgi:hypothetical protein